VEYIVGLYAALIGAYPSVPSSVGVIAPYRAQRRRLKAVFRERFGPGCDVEVSTIDGFQGREKDIIVMSCVRAPTANNRNRGKGRGGTGYNMIGFMKDWQVRPSPAQPSPAHCMCVYWTT
jgi:superfamily I DNA and/or RNA helicase